MQPSTGCKKYPGVLQTIKEKIYKNISIPLDIIGESESFENGYKFQTLLQIDLYLVKSKM